MKKSGYEQNNPKPIGSSELVKTDIKIRVLPRSSRNQIVGRDGDVFKVKGTSPPVDGMANQALIELLAKRLGVPKRRIEIISGKSSRLKSVRIHGLSLEDINSILER
jgi:uncharacterized protein (TIGR00251 family)